MKLLMILLSKSHHYPVALYLYGQGAMPVMLRLSGFPVER